jgi:dihydrofolate reductase
MKLTAQTFLTLDGVMQAPGAPDEDRDGGFAYGGWSFPFWDDETMQRLIVEQTNWADVVLFGRRTYEIFASHWPRVTDPNDPIAAKLNSVRKVVASRTLTQADWNNSTVISGDVAATVAKLKEEPGNEIQVSGSSDLLQILLKYDLVDELRLWIFPIVVGAGKRLFGNGTVPGAFRLTEATVTPTGVAIHRYERAGRVETGSFALEG